MQRRTVLRACLGVLGFSGLSGCIGSQTADSNDETESRSTPTETDGAEPTAAETTTSQKTPRLTVSDGEPVTGFPRNESGFATERVGSRNTIANPDNNLPHDLLIWNSAAHSQTITVEIRNQTGGTQEIVSNDTYEIPGDELLVIHLLEPAPYQVSLDGPTITEAATIEIPRDRFDCNESHHEITVTGTGEVANVVYSDAAGCPTPTTE